MRIKNQFCFHILFSYLTCISHYLQINYHLRSTKVLSLEMLRHCIKFLSVPAYSPSFVKQDHMYSHWSTILIQLFESSWRTNSPVLCITLHFLSHYTCMYIYLHTRTEVLWLIHSNPSFIQELRIHQDWFSESHLI